MKEGNFYPESLFLWEEILAFIKEIWGEKNISVNMKNQRLLKATAFTFLPSADWDEGKILSPKKLVSLRENFGLHHRNFENKKEFAREKK